MRSVGLLNIPRGFAGLRELGFVGTRTAIVVSESGDGRLSLRPVRQSLFHGRQNQTISASISRKGSPHRSDIVSRSRSSLQPSKWQGCTMGDKSPKSKDRQKKQGTAQKSQKKAAAFAKMNPAPALPRKKGK